MGEQEHRELADKAGLTVRCGVIVVSDTRTLENDTSGKAAFEILTKFGHQVIDLRLVRNDRKAVQEAVEEILKAGADFVMTTGGTGVSKKDLSVEALRPLIEKELPGFGELFRALSFREIGSAVIHSRALLGATSDGRLLAALPGSEAAVRLALGEILVNELKHLLWELRRHP